MKLARVIVFVRDVEAAARWYAKVFELPIKSCDAEWAELDAGGCAIGLHRGEPGHARTKIVFRADDVAAARTACVARGAELGPVKTFGALSLCDGTDPEGNPFQLSNRE